VNEDTTGTEDEVVEVKQSELDGLLPEKGVESLQSTMVATDHVEGGAGDPPTKDFIENIQRLGILEPLVVRPIGKGRYATIEGGRRLATARILGIPHVPVVIEDRPGLNPVAAGLAANFMRSPNFIKDARDTVDLIEHQGWTRRQVAAVTGMKISQIKAAQDMIAKLDPALIAAGESGKAGKWVCTHAARLEPPYQKMLVDKLETAGKLTDKDVINIRKLAEDAEIAKLPADLFEAPDEGIDMEDVHGRPADLVRNYEGPTDPIARGIDAAEAFERTLDELDSTPPEPKKEVKIGYPQRRQNARGLVLQARKELMAIKSNQRSDDDKDAILLLDEVLTRIPLAEFELPMDEG
jgi:ParB-like chromosome segregation protein Spo0J